MASPLTVSELAKRLKGTLVGDGETLITGLAGIREAKRGELTFLANPKYAPLLEQTQASAVILSEQHPLKRLPLSAIYVRDADLAFAQAAELFGVGTMPRPSPGIHSTAVVAPDAQLGRDISLGPHVVVERGASIGARSVLYAGVYVGTEAHLGEDCLVYPNVVIRERVAIGNRVTLHAGAVIGSDGFGYVEIDGVHHKIPQLGTAVIEDDVSIGANVTIDRARFDRTLIKKGTKIDNLVQIAHNVVIGENCVIAAQCGIAGSARIGDNVKMGGNVGIVGHVEIGDHSILAARAGISKDLPAGSVYSGYFAQPHRQTLQEQAILRRLPKLLSDIRWLKKCMEKLLGKKRNEKSTKDN